MYTLKLTFFAVIVVCVVIKAGKLLLKKTHFEKLFQTISGIIIIITFYTIITSFNIDDFKIQTNIKGIDYDSNNIEVQFENNLKKIIEEDIHNKYYVNLNIDVKTNMENLKIIIYGLQDKNFANEITRYIKNTYCTSNDEVIAINEPD